MLKYLVQMAHIIVYNHNHFIPDILLHIINPCFTSTFQSNNTLSYDFF